ncbi:hypothetical protein OAM01_01740 [bacterium]|nr:hypothetical protein [bacterium]
MNILFPSRAFARRMIASFVCLCWMMSFVYCQTVCLTGSEVCHSEDTSHNDSSASCHTPAKTDQAPCHSGSDSSGHESSMNCCCSMDVINHSSSQTDWVHGSELLFTQAWLTVCIEAYSSIEVDRAYLSSEFWLEWTLTLELRLGPGIHSHAPPLIS